jgi:hypothetical protein
MVDGRARAVMFLVPLNRGTPSIWSAFYVHFGTANWAQFCPGNEDGNRHGGQSVILVGMRLSFFVARTY